MAEIAESGGGGHKKGTGVKKGKKLSTRVDLTPMVDLGFLLITFFMFTTTMQKPKTMQINMPDNDKTITDVDRNKVKESTALTILLSKDHRIYYYEGIGSDPNSPPEVKVTYFKNQDGIRDAIINKKKKVADLKRTGQLLPSDATTVLIKPDDNSSYEDVVNILDEMNINDVTVYAIVDITPVDKDFIQKTEQANGLQ
jgi:biopolymer transport protein ExbD